MIKRILGTRLPLMVYNPPKVFDLGYFTRCHESGALPVLDTEFMTNTEVIAILDRLAAQDLVFGLRLPLGNQALRDYLVNSFHANLDLVVLTYRCAAELSAATPLPDYRMALEVRDIDLLAPLKDLEPHALVVRGNEAPGRVSRFSAFLLMQWYLENSELPVFVHGGVGWHTAAGMFAAGASGIVLDNQLYLAAEAPLAEVYKNLLRNLEDKDSAMLGETLRTPYRFFAKLGTRIVKELKGKELGLSGTEDPEAQLYREIEAHHAALDQEAAQPLQSLFYLGQDAIFARHFAARSPHLEGMLRGLFEQIHDQLAAVEAHDPLRPGAKLAEAHGTRLPIVQGPMANVSDNADFAAAVYAAGGLPFLALGSLPAHLADGILAAGKAKVPCFGAGMIGIETFNQTIAAHLESVKRHQVPFALFAGGSPSQVKELEAAGTKAYLHTPSVSMLENAVQNGCRRFIFEGGEAGGHVGTLSSLVLWELALEVIGRLPDDRLAGISLLFAGGIGTARASHFVSGMTARLAGRGAAVGIQVGTAYLFTGEIVETGAIKKVYQDVVCRLNDTIVMGTTVGLASRTVATPFAARMIANEHQRVREGLPLAERKKAFEQENIGALLIGAKAFCPDFEKLKAEGQVCLIHFDEEEQYARGNFMVGDALALNPCTTTIADVHAAFFERKAELHRTLNALEIFSSARAEIADEIAVIGMDCIFPGAASPAALWEQVMGQGYAIAPMPPERLDPALYYDPDRKAEDKSYTRLAGVVTDFTFDHARFGYTPEKAARLSRSQQMMLQCAYGALADAGYLDADDKLRAAWRASTAVIVASCLGNELGNNLHLKYWYPELKHYLGQIEDFQALDADTRTACLERLREGLAYGTDYEPVHGQLLNIEASRVAHHLGIEGVNYVVDAACATSLAALDCAVKELLAGEADLVVTGGVNTNLAPESFVGFSKMGALSATGSYPFDARADGFVLGEGAGVLVLKRMRDALRDGDRVLGVIKGLGSSSDGKGKAIAAPNTRGQALALQRCFAKIGGGVTTADIGYIEAHGTSTVAGDQAELETLGEVYRSPRPIGVSSVKSQIGHLLGAAGYAGLIKALLALGHRTLPPNGGFATLAPAHRLEGSPLFIIQAPAPWEAPGDQPRRAAVSSYGFGGINYHCVVEEATPAYRPLPRRIFADLDSDFNDRRLVFAGLGVVLPESPDVESFWQNLQAGRTVLSAIPPERFHNEAYAAEPEDSAYHIPVVQAGVVRDYRFDNARFRIPPKTARSIDRAQLFALDAAAQAIEASGLNKGQGLAAGNRVAVILGTLPGTRQVENILRVRLGLVTRLIEGLDDLAPETRRAIAGRLASMVRDRIPENNEDTIPGLLSNIVSGRVANTFGCNGANFVVDASCASATAALRLAAMGLRNGDYDAAITGGVDTNFYPAVMLAFKRLGLLSAGDCRFFDQRASGYVMSEGAAVQVLTTYRHAVTHGMPILGEFGHTSFRSSVPNHLLAPSEKTYGAAIADCYRHLPVARREVLHLDVFGVANQLLDMMEKQALETQFPKGVCYGNIKPEFGYFKSANPAVVVTKLLLMNRHQALLPHFSHDPETSIVGPASHLAANPRLQDLARHPVRYFATNVNGVGGNHAHTVIGALPPRLAARSLPAAAQPHAARGAAPAIAAKPGGVVALVSGQGAQYGGMLQPLYQTHPTIRRRMDEGERIFQEMRGYSLLELMFGGSPRLNQTENTQPAVFLTSAAIFAHLQDRGFAPDAFIGHSVGEYTSLCCAGLLDFETALRLVIKRGDFMQAAAQEHPGRIMVVFQDADEVLRLIGASGIANVWVANKNSEKQTAVSGAREAIEAFGHFLKQHNVMSKVLSLSGAFHTPLFASAAERMAAHLEGIRFIPAEAGRIISNVTAAPYPADEAAVKKLLVRQIVSPVEFIRSVQNARRAGMHRFVEVGPGRLLVNLLKNITLEDYEALPSADPKLGESESLAHLERHLAEAGLVRTPAPAPSAPPAPAAPPPTEAAPLAQGRDFEDFLAQNEAALKQVLYQEFLKQKQAQRLKELENFNFYTGPTVVAGVSIGLPGTGNKVFNSNNFDKILAGTNFIEPLTHQEKEKILDMNITRVFKQPDGSARFLDISDTREVIQLAGKLGYFNLKNEYGVDYDYDITIALAMAAGIEALKDAQIPLVMQHRQTSKGNRIPTGYALPDEMQATTGVIMTSLFPGFETLIEQMNRYYYNKFYIRPYKELENIYYHLMASVQDPEIKEQITDWFFKIKERRKKYGTYKFERNLLFDVVPLGSAHFAQLIKARGPNMMMSGACASTTQSIGVAEDWIRTGRCERVVIIGGEASTSEVQSPWIASGFLALGAATIKNVVSEAAKPFDAERNGTILGAGAVGLIVERQDRVQARGLNGQAEILGTYIGNSAFHATQIDVRHLQEEMGRFVRGIERRHGLEPEAYTRSLVFMSHETFTPARGGSASAEVASLKATYPEHYRGITVTNTKGFTGHTLGAAIEDAVLVKALQQGKVPPIANLTTIPEEFADLQFSGGTAAGRFDYGLHYAAGFGSHFAFLFLRRLEEAPAAGNAAYQAWLKRITGLKGPRLSLINNTLCVDPHVPAEISAAAPAARSQTPAPPAKAPAAVPATAPAPGAAAAVKAIIAEQTGYALDMLEDDLDLEADLGIDTVKQVEIFGRVAARFGLEVPEDLKLRDLNTIARLTAYIAARTAAAPAAPALETLANATPTVPVEAAPADGPIRRFTVGLAPAPATPPGGPALSGRRILVTTDGQGVVELVAARIRSAGGEPVTLGSHAAADVPADLADPTAVAAALDVLKAAGKPIDGIIHLQPLDGYFDAAPQDRRRIGAGVKALFALVQGLFEDLRRPGTLLAVPAVNSVVFPHDERPSGPIDPLFAGIAGLLKTARKELPATRVKVVDWAQPDRSTRHLEALVDALMAEITGTDPRVEVGYRDGGRFVPRLVETPAGTDGAVVRPGDTLLVTGGAQGITFEMLQALTRTTPVNLVILGRSDLEELARIPGGATAAPPALMEELKARLPGAKPVAIRQALERLLRIRDTRAHLAALEAAGIRVDYHPADVTDAAAVAAVVARYPRIDGVIHAAGLEESRLIPGKTAASFDRVFDTKVFGALHLMEALEARAVRFFLAFSSVTARFGNEGQADYTAANDMLGKLLLAWRAAAPGRIVRVLAWTAWEGAGMATRETVRKVLQERGLQFLPLADGVARFLVELRDESATEVVISGYDRAFDPDGLLPRAPEAATGGGPAPFLDQRLEADAGRAVFARVLDPARDRFLHDHAREGVPIFLGATGIEAMAEAAASLAAPGATLRELRDFSIPYGIKILKGRPKELQIDAVRTGTAGDTFLCRITSQFRNPKGVAMGSPTLHYRGTYVFDRQTPAAPAIALPDFQPPGYAGDIQALLYHPKRLFMDGLFRTVEDILSFDGQMLVSRIRAAGDGAFFADGRPTDFTTDIRVVDAMFQTGGMLEVMSSNIIVLPYAIGRMVFHRPLPPGQAFLCLTERTRAGRETNTYQLRLTDAGGGLYLTIEDFEMVQLEQLAPEHQILDRLNLERRAS